MDRGDDQRFLHEISEGRGRKKAKNLLLAMLLTSLLPLPAYSQPAKKVKSIAVVYNNRSIGMLPLWITADAGLFQKNGLDVKLDFAQGTMASNAMVAGQYQIGNVSAPAVLGAVAQGVSLKITAALFSRLLYALVAAKDIHDPSELRGKVFGISKIGDSSWSATQMILRKLHVDPSLVTLLSVGNSPERLAALMGGHIDAMIADPMDVVTARRKGFPVLATQQQLDIQYVGSAIAMQGDFIKHDRETAMLFLKAISEGIHYYKTRQEEAAKIAAKYLKSNDTEAITSAVSVFASTIIPNIPVVTPGAIAPIQEGLAKSGSPGVKELKYEQFVDNSLVQELEKQGFYKQLYGN